MSIESHATETPANSSLVISALDHEIAKLQASLVVMKNKKRLLDRAILEHRELLSPFRQLPDDILAEIFICCLPEDGNACMSAREPPLVLGRVCSRWRTLAYGFPRLWTTLHFSSPISPPEHSWNSMSSWVPPETRQQVVEDFVRLYRNHFDAIRDWLNRAYELPLCLSIDLEANVSSLTLPFYTEMLNQYLQILLSCSARWRSFELVIPSWAYVAFLTCVQSHSLTSLKYLNIIFSSRPSRRPSYRSYWKDSGLLSSQALQVLHLSRNHYRLSDLGIHWAQITHFTLGATNGATSSRTKEGASLKEAYTMFRDCKRLEYCSLEIIEDRRQGFSPTNTVILPRLSTLVLMDGALSLDILLQHLQTPALCDLTYYTRFSPSTSRRSPLVSLLRQSSNTIHSLTTTLDFFTVNDLAECFYLVPHLKHLVNGYSWPPGKTSDQQRLWRKADKPFEKKMMKATLDLLLLNKLSDGGYPCPELESLTLTESLGLTDRDALNILQQRLESSRLVPTEVGRLSKIHIHFDNAISVDVHAVLQSYIDEGLKLTISYPLQKSYNYVGRFHTLPYSGLQRNLLTGAIN